MPGIAFKAHEDLKLSESCSCISINSGCTAFVEGIALVHDLMVARNYNKALLLVGDVLSKNINIEDSSTAPIFGDCGSATLLKKNNNDSKYVYSSGTKPKSTTSIKLSMANSQNNFLMMNGMEVFNFTINGIPKHIDKVKGLWEEKYKYSANIDYYFFHQANRMILTHVAKKINLPLSKIPINIENYGNTSGSTIPLLLCETFNKNPLINNSTILMSGFGVGLSWSCMITNLINLKFIKIIFVKS